MIARPNPVHAADNDAARTGIDRARRRTARNDSANTGLSSSSPTSSQWGEYLHDHSNGCSAELAVCRARASPVLLSTASGGVTIILAVNSIQFVGTSMIIYLAGLQAIAPEYIEAATLDGANAWQRFRHVVVPLLQPAFATSVVLNLIGGLKLFDVIQVMTGGGPGTSTSSVSTLIGRTYFDNQAAGYSAAMGVALFFIIAVLTVLVNAALNRRRLEQQ